MTYHRICGTLYHSQHSPSPISLLGFVPFRIECGLELSIIYLREKFVPPAYPSSPAKWVERKDKLISASIIPLLTLYMYPSQPPHLSLWKYFTSERSSTLVNLVRSQILNGQSGKAWPKYSAAINIMLRNQLYLHYRTYLM